MSEVHTHEIVGGSTICLSLNPLMFHKLHSMTVIMEKGNEETYRVVNITQQVFRTQIVYYVVAKKQ